MPLVAQAPQRASRVGSASVAPLGLLAGCMSAGDAGGSAGLGLSIGWLLALALTLALTLALVAAAYLLGSLRAAARHREDLRQSRELLRAQEQLCEGWHWRADPRGQLTHWHSARTFHDASGDSPGALFEADSPLQAHLAARQAFHLKRLQLARAAAGCLEWAAQGVPLFDDSGAFAGFVGSARPLVEDRQLRLAAALLRPSLDAFEGEALLVQRKLQVWSVLQCSESLKQSWPAAAPGAALEGARGVLPTEVLDGLAQAAAAGQAKTLSGWRVLPLPVPQDAAGEDAPCLLLRRPPATRAEAATGAASDSTQMTEADNFGFTLSHDLRAPIRVVEGFTRIVKEDYGRLLDRVGNDHLDRVLGAVARMNLMIDALLNLARLSQQPLAQQRVNLSQLAAFVVDDLRRGAPEREASFEIAPGLAAMGDPTLLRMVLENLLGNAWKYTARSSHVRISLQAVPHPSQLAFQVRDNGAGFDMRGAERLFGLFQRLHSASDFPGHGVGLASVRRIVQRHGGQVWAESEPGRGAAFTFTLPG